MFLSRLFRSKDTENRRFVETYFGQLLLVIIGATVSIIFTLGAANMVNRRNRRENQRLSAMMVMSNIEQFARTMETRSERMASNDSIAAWLLSKPIEELELLPDKQLRQMVNQATTLQFLSHDKSAENIFSNNIETWTNIGNVQFIDRVGQCFSAMNTVEEYWNKWVNEVDETTKAIDYHPDDYEGSTLSIKYMKNEKVRSLLQAIHTRRGWLNYVAATMRYHNLHNMASIDISEEEVIAFTDNRERDAENDNPVPRSAEYFSPALNADSLFTFGALNMMLDSLKGR